MNYWKYYIRAILAGIFSLLFLFTSCNDEYADPLRKDYPANELEERHGNVLLIVLDGASGAAIKQANNDRRIENLRAMMSSSLYTFNGLADTRADTLVTDELGLNNLLTGMQNNTSATPSFIQRMKEIKEDSRISVYASTDYFYEKCKGGSDVNEKGTDVQLVDKVVSSLQKEGTVPDLTVLELNSIQQSGQSAGFYEKDGNPTEGVMSAIATTDKFIGRIMNALKARPEYSNENWLVIVTSNYGGDENNEGESVYDMKDRNTFSLLYNERFTSKLQLIPSADEQRYTYFTPLYSGSGATDYAKVNDPTLFDFNAVDSLTNDTCSYTLQFMYYASLDKHDGLSMVSKAIKNNPGTAEGWQIYQTKSSFASYLGGQRNTSKGITLIDGDWHVITMVVDYHKQAVFLYQDGEKSEYPGRDSLSMIEYKKAAVLMTGNKAPLTIGWIFRAQRSNKSRFSVTNLQIYNVALPASYIKKNYNLTGLDKLEDFSYWDNLIGYWPCDREEDKDLSILKDYSKYGSVYNGINAGKSDMTLSSNARWISGSSVEKNVRQAVSSAYYQAVMNVADIPYQMFQWLGLNVPVSWGWSGIARALPYADLTTNN